MGTGILLAVIGFLAGSIPFGWILTRVRGIDIQRIGSGNIGATNVTRALGPGWGFVVFLLDAAKGGLPVVLARTVAPEQPAVWAWTGLAAICGHMFTPWLRFRGGKGVATGFGAFLAIAPWAAVMAFGTFLVVLSVFRIVSVASLTAATAFVIYLRAFFHTPWAMWWPAFFAVVLIWIRHRDNILRLMRGQEVSVIDDLTARRRS